MKTQILLAIAFAFVGFAASASTNKNDSKTSAAVAKDKARCEAQYGQTQDLPIIHWTIRYDGQQCTCFGAGSFTCAY